MTSEAEALRSRFDRALDDAFSRDKQRREALAHVEDLAWQFSEVVLKRTLNVRVVLRAANVLQVADDLPRGGLQLFAERTERDSSESVVLWTLEFGDAGYPIRIVTPGNYPTADEVHCADLEQLRMAFIEKASECFVGRALSRLADQEVAVPRSAEGPQ